MWCFIDTQMSVDKRRTLPPSISLNLLASLERHHDVSLQWVVAPRLSSPGLPAPRTLQPQTAPPRGWMKRFSRSGQSRGFFFVVEDTWSENTLALVFKPVQLRIWTLVLSSKPVHVSTSFERNHRNQRSVINSWVCTIHNISKKQWHDGGWHWFAFVLLCQIIVLMQKNKHIFTSLLCCCFDTRTDVVTVCTSGQGKPDIFSFQLETNF